MNAFIEHVHFCENVELNATFLQIKNLNVNLFRSADKELEFELFRLCEVQLHCLGPIITE